MPMDKERLDIILTERGLVESRSQAQRLIMAGEVRVDGQIILKASIGFSRDADITIEKGPPFVSRGGEKLEAGLKAFGLSDLSGMVCVDVGASTGGFTDCLLQHGAAKIYAVDVGNGLLHWKLRNHPSVVVMEKMNARYLERFEERINLVTIDASFITLKVLLPPVKGWLADNADVIALIKPQFEAGRKVAAKGKGVIRDLNVHRTILEDTLHFSIGQGFAVKGLIRSPLKGPKGNAEFLTHLRLQKQDDMADLSEIAKWVESVLE
jgi:23S rRNA (cytidine1920-2'-O)/16S rRNA (cytidine1409-2'-O)-methyltransferase